MYKILTSLLLAFIALLSFSVPAYAIVDPLSVPNNKFGIHMHDENDLNDANSLVNSSGGNWGYVTFVIREDERDFQRWQNAFDKMRRLHLIPIVRIASRQNQGIWEEPKKEEINNWIAFLNSLNWVVKNRYVIIGNEPNHAKEWGGKISPENYAEYLVNFSEKLKAENEDYFILPAALDASASTTRATLEESVYLKRMFKKVPNLENYIDGINSHSYPNPAFSGKETDNGKGSIRTFEWERNYLRSLGVKKDLPIFITETGWSTKSLEDTEVGRRLIYAFQNVWDDGKIVAVTPFILNYTEEPFDEFSWRNGDNSYRSFYGSIQNLIKSWGEPEQVERGRIFGVFVNPIEIAESSVNGVLLAQNLGQSIWVSDNLTITDQSRNIKITTNFSEAVEPKAIRLVPFKFETPRTPGIYKIPFVLESKNKNISDSYPFDIAVLEAPDNTKEVKKVSLFDTIASRIKAIKALFMAKSGR